MAEEANDVFDVDITKELRKLRRGIRLTNVPVAFARLLLKWRLRRRYPLSQMYDIYLWSEHLHGTAPHHLTEELNEENALLHAILGIHARALRTTWGTIILLREGLADEAYARSRTIDELRITGEFLQEHPTAALPYCLHDVVDNRDAVRRFPGHWENELGHERTYDTLVEAELIAEGTKPRNGWAAEALGRKAGSSVPFADIREEVDGMKHSPEYSQASQQVHANRVGLLGLGASPDGTVNLRGSEYGLGVPVTNITSSLVRLSLCASSVYGTFGDEERISEETLITWNLGRRVWDDVTPTNPVVESNGD